MGQENIRVEPMYASLRGGQVSSISTVADLASSLNNKYFKIQADAGAISYAVWYNVGAAGVAPTVVGYTLVPVAIAAGSSAVTVASATATALSALAQKFTVSVSGSVITVTTVMDGATAAVADGAAPTGFIFALVKAGLNYDLGLIEGDISLGFKQDAYDIKSHQTGTQVLDSINIGSNLDAIKINLMESHVANLQTVLTGTGVAYTPTSGTQVIGIGTSQRFQVLSTQGYKLVLHPVRAVTGDLSKDLCFWKATPQLDSLAFSGEKATILGVSFKIALDTTKVDACNQFVFGDWTQNFAKAS